MATNKESISIRLKPKQIERLKAIAEEKDMTFSELIRQIVDNFISLR